MSKRTWALVFKAPAILLLIASFLAGIYAEIYDIQEMGWGVMITLGGVIFLYIIGFQLEKMYYKELKSENKKSEEAF